MSIFTGYLVVVGVFLLCVVVYTSMVALELPPTENTEVYKDEAQMLFMGFSLGVLGSILWPAIMIVAAGLFVLYAIVLVIAVIKIMLDGFLFTMGWKK